ncbi:MAG: cytochrome c3 family protein [Candidatus Krumholzibacteriia bacterium]
MEARRTYLAMLAIAALTLGIAACDDDDDDPVGAQPVITAVTATPQIVEAGGTATVAVEAPGAGLQYVWTAEAGTFADASEPTTTWTAPEEPGVYTLTATVTNNRNLSASRARAVGVEVGLELTAQSDTLTIAHSDTITASAVGDGLVYAWEATSGTVTRIAPDRVVFRAPDAVPATNPRVQVIVADEAGNARSEFLEYTVLPYTPTDSPSYMGADYCQQCHPGIHADWHDTGHAEALAGLLTSDHVQPFCFGCHVVGSVGLNADPALDNRAWNDVPLASLADVQCENCHGPGSAHPGGGMPTLPTTVDAELCGSCHNGVHHPTYDEWQQSGHGVADELTSPVGRTACVKCHNGAYAAGYLDDPEGFQNPSAVADTAAITCAACHDPHGSPNEGNLRAAAATDVVLPNGQVVPEAGNGRLCMACHNGRRAPGDILDMIENGSSHFGPHHSVQGDMLAGTGAYEEIAPGFDFGTSRHLLIDDGCVHCHTNPAVDPLTGQAFTGHTFEPTLEACRDCHGPIQAFSDVMASDDFDGDGTVEGIQHEVQGLTALLRQAIIAASDTPEHAQALQEDFDGNVGNATISTREQREAAYNLFFVEFDHSSGVHNARYSIQLLQQTIQALAPAKTARMVMLVE